MKGNIPFLRGNSYAETPLRHLVISFRTCCSVSQTIQGPSRPLHYIVKPPSPLKSYTTTVLERWYRYETTKLN